MEDSSAKWTHYKKVRNLYLIIVISFLPLAFVALELARPHIVVVFTLFAVPYFLAMLIAGYRFTLWRCPRCGNTFTDWWRLNKGIFARRCVHCGLAKYASSNPEARALG
jgi:Zn ribbon nucleic-acid-binding protein